MAYSRAGAEAARRARARADAAAPRGEPYLLECGHETLEPPLVRFNDGRQRFACADCGGTIRKEKGTR